MAKLTLHIPDDLVLAAKVEAADRQSSVSKMVSSYFMGFTRKKTENPAFDVEDLAPHTKRLLGCIKGTDWKDTDREDYIDHLEKKHS